MSRSLRVLVPALAVLAVFALPSLANAQTTPVLRASVGTPSNPDAFDIRLTREDGSPLGSLDPGTYTIVVNDYSTMHNFHLFGPGVDRRTGIAFVGTVTWTPVRLRVGTYVFRCDAHPLTMRKTFVVR